MRLVRFGLMIDNVGGGEMATDHLLKLGYRKVAFIGGSPPMPISMP